MGPGKTRRFLVLIEEVSRDMGEERVTVNGDRDKVFPRTSGSWTSLREGYG
jgi:hypothetical protein